MERFRALFLGDPKKQFWGWDGLGVLSNHPTTTKGMSVPPDKGDSQLPLQVNGKGQSIWSVAARHNQPDFISRLHYLRSNTDVPSVHALALEASVRKVDINNQVREGELERRAGNTRQSHGLRRPTPRSPRDDPFPLCALALRHRST